MAFDPEGTFPIDISRGNSGMKIPMVKKQKAHVGAVKGHNRVLLEFLGESFSPCSKLRAPFGCFFLRMGIYA